MKRHFLGALLGILCACAPLPSTTPAPISAPASPYYTALVSQDYRALSSFWSRLGDDQRALRYWEAITTPSLSQLRIMAQTYLDLGEWNAAYASLQQLVSLTPEDTWANYQLGLLLIASDRPQARLYLRRSQADGTSDPLVETLQALLLNDDPVSAFQVGQVLAEAGEWRAAERAFLYASALEPSATALNLAYSALMRNLQNKDAQALIQQALALAPQDPTVQYIYGILLRGDERYYESLLALSAAYALNPDNAVFVAEVGMAYHLLDDPVSAQEWIQQAFVLAEGQPALRAVLQRYAQYGNATVLLPELPEP